MTDFYHLLVTIFNVKEDVDVDIETVTEWTSKRYPLFEKFCLPSVLAQSEKNFEWVIFIDRCTEPKIKSKLQKLSQQYDFIFIGELDSIPQNIDGIRDFALSRKKKVNKIITTRFDNDDIIHKDFIKTIQQAFRNGKGKRVINLTNGYNLLITKRPYLLFASQIPENPFISLVEEYNERMETVKQWIHNHWSQYVHIQNIVTDPMWIQLIHERNIWNHVQGKPIAQPDDLSNFQLDDKDATHKNTRKHQIALANQLIKKVKNKFTKN